MATYFPFWSIPIFRFLVIICLCILHHMRFTVINSINFSNRYSQHPKNAPEVAKN